MGENFITSASLNENIYSDGNFIIGIEKNNIDGSFVLHHLVADFVKRFGSSTKVILILNQNSLLHWDKISNRLGWNVKTLLDSGKLELIDILESTSQFLMSNCEPEECGASKGPQSCDSISHLTPERPEPNVSSVSSTLNCDGELDLDTLLSTCRSKMEKLLVGSRGGINENSSIISTNDRLTSNSSNSGHYEGEEGKAKVLIILENFSNLIEQQSVPKGAPKPGNWREKTALDFLYKLRTLFEKGSEVLIATLVESDMGNRTHFVNTLSKVLASVSFEVSPLQSGASSKVDGYLVVRRQSKSLWSPQDRWIKNFHYKLEEKTVTLNAL